eukprot:122376-Chlamydomonas_euryale.AAC.2
MALRVIRREGKRWSNRSGQCRPAWECCTVVRAPAEGVCMSCLEFHVQSAERRTISQHRFEGQLIGALLGHEAHLNVAGGGRWSTHHPGRGDCPLYCSPSVSCGWEVRMRGEREIAFGVASVLPRKSARKREGEATII